MFTGLIEETGTIKEIKTTSAGSQITIQCKNILDGIKIGDSISVNGVCQSVTDIAKDCFKTDLSIETINVTTFKSIKQNEIVNLERALKLGQRLDGHIVSGHVDSIAEFVNSEEDGFSTKMYFKVEPSTSKYIVYKGSITINGISLTVASITNTLFSVEIIPITIKNTNLLNLKKGDKVNIETDILAKYVEKFLLLNNNNTTSIDENLLKENGFI